MTRNPMVNAAAASLYITFIGLMMNWGVKNAPKGPDTIMAPIAMISLFTLSAAVMGYLFCYQPAQLYFDGKKKTAVTLFLQTILVFGILTAVSLGLLFFGVIR